MLRNLIIFVLLSLSFNPIQANTFKELHLKKEYHQLYFSMTRSLDNQNTLIYEHIIDSVSDDGSLVTLEDGSSVFIDWMYRSSPKKWKNGESVHISFDFSSQKLKLEHCVLKNTAWGNLKELPFQVPTIKSLSNAQNKPDAYSKLTLSNSCVFRSVKDEAFVTWALKDRVLILANSNELYQLWNVDKKEITLSKLTGNRNQDHAAVEIEDILGLEERLNQKVLQQPEASHAITTALLNYAAGLKEKERPIGVFLFLGPTGVGKTELAKALTQEIYKDSTKMLRFDMSHFTESHSISRLIGSPPGYVNHEEGGQLTEPLLEDASRIVLLDEMEKAHPQVHKAFLPVFDEGFILDSKNNRIECSHTIFIMTSNLCGPEIAELYRCGYSAEDILEIIEPSLIESLSPELYNRVEPVVFHPLEKETMGALVDLLLKQLTDKLIKEKGIHISIGESLKEFLIEKGYHPLLGARPLKKLIEKRVVAALAYNIILHGFGQGCELSLSYDQETDKVLVQQNL